MTNRISISIWFALAIGLLLPTAVTAQPRTWSFSKDIVYGGSIGSSIDTVQLTNQGVDTLKFDTVVMEIIRPNMSDFAVRFHVVGSPGYYHVWRYEGSDHPSTPPPKSIVVPPGQSVRLNEFYLNVTPFQLAKSSAQAAIGDTMQARLIFQGAAGRGRDTVIASGIQQTTGLRMPSTAGSSYEGRESRLFDLRGRRVEQAPKAGSIPVPLFAPKESRD